MPHTDDIQTVSADDIAEKAMSGEDISQFFSNTGVMCSPVHNISINIAADMLHEIDCLAAEMNVDRQAVIKTYLRHSLDQHYLAKSWRKSETQGEQGVFQPYVAYR